MGTGEKLVEAMRRAVPKLGPELRKQLAGLLSTENQVMLGGILGGWALLHLAGGAGLAVDAWLGFWMAYTLGRAASQALSDLIDFGITAARARTEADLDRAAASFAEFVGIAGLTVLFALIGKLGGRLAGTGRATGGGGEPPTFGAAVERSPGGGGGPWWEVSEPGPNWEGTSVPQTFTMKVGGQVFKVLRNATEHMWEYAREPVMKGEGRARQQVGWSSKNPWGSASEVDYPLSSLAGALEQAAKQLKGTVPGEGAPPVQGAPAGYQYPLMYFDNWEIGLAPGEGFWKVTHAMPDPRGWIGPGPGR
jgi:hypothetical protein